MRCWACGIEPIEVVEVSTLASAQPLYLAGRWPEGDHEHSAWTPTPAQLEQLGHEALMRMAEDA